MKERIYWIVAGGFSFWLPAILTATSLHENISGFVLNIVPLIGMTLYGTISWKVSNRPPKWVLMLVGVYIFGPISMLAPSIFLHESPATGIPREGTWLLIFCIFPPMTPWMATLNGMIFSVLIVTLALPVLAKYWKSHA